MSKEQIIPYYSSELKWEVRSARSRWNSD